MPYPKTKTRAKRTRYVPNKKATIKLIDDRINRNSEMKHLDNTYSSGVSYIGTTINITNIPQGDGDNQRIGDVIQFDKLQVNLEVEAIDPFNVVRVMVLQWYPNEGVDTCEVNKVLQSVNILAMPNWHRRSDYRILYDTLLKADSDDPITTKRFIIKSKIRKIMFNEGVNVGHGQLFMLLISDSSTLNHPVVTYHKRLTYYDR